MRIVFFGTPYFSAQILKYLFETGHEIVGVVTMPDKPQGRSQRISPTPVKSIALEWGPEDLPLFQPEKASTPEMEEALKALKPDLFVVVGYGEIIRQNLLDIPRLDPINIHTSLLPAYRGAAPIRRAIMAGEKRLGITIMEMVKAMDAGDIILQEGIDTTDSDTFGSIEERLLELAKKLIVKVIELYEKEEVRKTPQNPQQVTFAPKIRPDDCRIDWQKSAKEVLNQIRAFSPKPGAYTLFGSKRLKVIEASYLPSGETSPGDVLVYKGGDFHVSCGKGIILFKRLQLEGKKCLSVLDFINGNPIQKIK